MDSMESPSKLHERHRTELKVLQAKIIQKKKGASKKTRKGIIAECENLELNLRERQEQERENIQERTAEAVFNSSLTQLQISSMDPLKDEFIHDKNSSADNTAQAHKLDNYLSNGTQVSNIPLKRRNRQKERLARRAAETEAAIEKAKQEILNQPDKKSLERNIILNQCTIENLTEKLICPNGHCLFSAVADQLTQVGIPVSSVTDNGQPEIEPYRDVRKAAAKYIEEHPDDFESWLDEPLVQYVDKIKNTAEWGGHIELMALARNYNVSISIIQDGEPQIIDPLPDETNKPKKIWLAYYRCDYGLGEHYNSLRSTH